MNNHNRKEPPLREQVNHKSWVFSKFIDIVLYVVFALVMGFTLGGLFD